MAEDEMAGWHLPSSICKNTSIRLLGLEVQIK